MLEFKGDLFSDINNPEAVFCIPTNGIVKSDGRAVMGAGLAKFIRDKYIYSDKLLGFLISKNGNIVQKFYDSPALIAFPTKKHWKDDSSRSLIQKSCQQLINLINEDKNINRVYLPKVGSGMGSLDFEKDVRPILLQEFQNDDRFIILHP